MNCPFCKAEWLGTAATIADAPPPSDGDAALCSECFKWCIFDGKAPGGVRQPSAREDQQLAENETAMKMQFIFTMLMH
jgi:hypothetical protein